MVSTHTLPPAGAAERVPSRSMYRGWGDAPSSDRGLPRRTAGGGTAVVGGALEGVIGIAIEISRILTRAIPRHVRRAQREGTETSGVMTRGVERHVSRPPWTGTGT